MARGTSLKPTLIFPFCGGGSQQIPSPLQCCGQMMTITNTRAHVPYTFKWPATASTQDQNAYLIGRLDSARIKSHRTWPSRKWATATDIPYIVLPLKAGPVDLPMPQCTLAVGGEQLRLYKPSKKFGELIDAPILILKTHCTSPLVGRLLQMLYPPFFPPIERGCCGTPQAPMQGLLLPPVGRHGMSKLISLC